MIVNILLKDIQPNPWQTRVGEPDEEYIKGLAYDIAINGLLQIPVGRFPPDHPSSTPIQLAFGHNRLAAYKLLAEEDSQRDDKVGYDCMPVDIRDLDDKEMANAAWSENEKRRDVSPIERALAIQKRIEDFGWSQADAANMLGVDRSTISNLLRLLKLPDGLRANIQAGEISERQAMALLPLFEAPKHDQNYAYSYYYKDPEQIVRQAIEGESSDKLRGRVDEYFKYVSKPLEKTVVKLDDLYPEGNGVYCGLCRTCDKRMSSRNLCFLPECFEAKVKYKEREYLSAASIASGYPLSDENKGGSVSQPYSDKMEIIRKTGCPNLCLVYSEGEVREPYNIKGFPHAHLVCDKRNNSCSCEKGLNVRAVQRIENTPAIVTNNGHEEIAGDDEISETSQPLVTSSDLEEAARQARKDKRYAIEQHSRVNERLVEMLVQALKDDEPGMFYVVAYENCYVYSFKGDDLTIENIYQKMANQAARIIMPEDYDNMDDLVRQTNQNLERLDLPAISLQKTLVEVFAEEEAANEMPNM